MSIPQKKNTYTYKQYQDLNEDTQFEVIDGTIYNMSPSPNVKHQEIAMQLSVEFGSFLRGKTCKAYYELDVCLTDEEDEKKITEWVKPDLIVVCDPDKRKANKIIGSPDIAIEILSKSTLKLDKMIKFHHYQKAGIHQYWIVDPVYESIDVFILKNGVYQKEGTYANDDVLSVPSFEGFDIHMKDLFV
ncbi:Uma2 family endonuclease [Shouchella sp. JSM 1781072]|uniref:Uma2 family endonuclease n=1 Tax=Shouchella sp. JSM 1781072 TaxID=3344581 RepID=UPI0035BF8DD2